MTKTVVDTLHEAFSHYADNEALIWRNKTYSYSWLAQKWDQSRTLLKELSITQGQVVSLESEATPSTIALLLALIENNNCIVPLTKSVTAHKDEFQRIAEIQSAISYHESSDSFEVQHFNSHVRNSLLTSLQKNKKTGLVLFSSGSTGQSKAVLHDLTLLLEKFLIPRKAMRMIAFLLFDHIGGINTILYSLFNGGCIISPEERSPSAICRLIAQHKIEVLPTSPSFLNLLLVSQEWKKHDLSSLNLITYGTEVMPQTTLERLHEALPHVNLHQTYGLSELGILQSKSEASNSLFVKIGGKGFETRVKEGLLEIKAHSAMIGYLNAPSPFTSDGWFQTNDAVEVKGEYVRFLGRQSEIINVGGEKVYPAEVENVLQTMPGVEEAAVSGEPNALLGHIVKANIKLSTDEDLPSFRTRMRSFCADKLSPTKIPQKVELKNDNLMNARFKRVR